MSEAVASGAAPPAPPSAPAAVAQAPAPPSRAATVAGLLAKAADAFTTPSSPPATDATPTTPGSDTSPTSSALPSTPEAPATAAVLEREETASALIRQKHELATARKALEAERGKWRQEQAEQARRVEQMERAFAAFEADPVAFAKAHGGKRSLVDLARDLYIEDGEIDKLPPEQAAPLKAERELMRLRREQQKMQAELSATQQEQRLAVYRGQLAAGLAQVGEGTPLVRALAASDPQMVLAQMERMAGEIAVSRPELGVQSAAQLATLLEPHLAKQLEDTSTRFKDWFTKKFQVAAPVAAPTTEKKPAPPAAKVAADKTLSRDLTPATPARSGKLSLAERLALATSAFDGR